MPTINESVVENAALKWFGELGYVLGHCSETSPSLASSVVLGRSSNGRTLKQIQEAQAEK